MLKAFGIVGSALLGGLLFPFAYHSENLIPGWLSAVAVFVYLVPILLVTSSSTPKEAFRLGYIFGFLQGVLNLYWVTIALSKYGNLHLGLSAFLLMLLLFLVGLYPAIALWFTSHHRNKKFHWLMGALAFTLLEWTRVYIPLEGFPWLTPAYALYDFHWLIQNGEFFGIVGFNFLLFAGNFALAEGVMRFQRGQRYFWRPSAVILAALVSLTFIGYRRLMHWDGRGFDAEPVSFSLLQGNISQAAKLDPSRASDTLKVYEALMNQASLTNPDLVIWPEAAMPFLMDRNTSYFSFLRRIRTDSFSIIGAATRAAAQERHELSEYYNSAFFVDSKGEVLSRYDKIHLVPFGEYVPLAKLVPIRRFIPAIAGVFEKGPSKQRLPKFSGQPFSIMICYEILFPDMALQAVRQGATFFVNITNDAWFDQTSGPYQHENFSVFRAIEFRRPILRAANTGFSLWVDSSGRKHGRTDFFTQDIVSGSIVPVSYQTFYSRFPLLMPILLIGTLLYFVLRRRRADES